MKPIVLFIFISIAANAHAQQADIPAPEPRKIFLRLYDDNDNKIGDGDFVSATDSTLLLKKGRKTKTVPVTTIYAIKTKHGYGYSVLVGTTSGLFAGSLVYLISAMAIMGQTNIASDTEYNLGLVAIMAPVAGAAVGIGAEQFRKSDTFLIHGNTAEWLVVKGQLGL